VLHVFDPDKTGSVLFEELLLAFCLCTAGSGLAARELRSAGFEGDYVMRFFVSGYFPKTTQPGP
jgi:hypothetical protein